MLQIPEHAYVCCRAQTPLPPPLYIQATSSIRPPVNQSCTTQRHQLSAAAKGVLIHTGYISAIEHLIPLHSSRQYNIVVDLNEIFSSTIIAHNKTISRPIYIENEYIYTYMYTILYKSTTMYLSFTIIPLLNIHQSTSYLYFITIICVTYHITRQNLFPPSHCTPNTPIVQPLHRILNQISSKFSKELS